MESRFLMLLVDSEGCRIGESGGVERSVRRGMREGTVGFDLETISDQNIGFRGVVANGVTGGVDASKAADSDADKAGGSVGDADGGEDEDDEVANAAVIEGGGGFCSPTDSFGFLLCFVRTCSCSLVLLSNPVEQRLHTKPSSFRFVTN